MATIRTSRRIERAGVNAIRTLLEDHDHIVQEIDGGNDHGEDLFVILTRGRVRTGHIVAIQVKSGMKYKRANGYAIPIEDHYVDWKGSRIPVLGVVYDPDSTLLYWTNITKRLQSTNESPGWLQISRDAELSSGTIRGFVAEIEIYIDRQGMRIRGASEEESFAGAARARRGHFDGPAPDPEAAPNPLFEGLGDLALRYEEAIGRGVRFIRRVLPLTVLALVMALEWPKQIQFAENYGGGFSPVMWTLNIYCFIFYAALTIFFEFRAGRIPRETGRWLSLIVGNILWIPVVDNGRDHGWYTTTWIWVGVIAPSLGWKFLLINFVGDAMERRRRLRDRGSRQDL
ncbi:DUF4365 domain-containing protein [Kitasatospora aureofaciens]|uniref:DUF4365 domain-containing protein n=1 Tax=Kitasatospora aureofaciens TaxID=1894 RepID=UPI0036F4A141